VKKPNLHDYCHCTSKRFQMIKVKGKLYL